ncbi:MAG: VCBS repeat-containing protein [Saprospiraceae bacterium]|nr:VCBS repeat-containing protein [Saprospiraceae bacterium]
MTDNLFPPLEFKRLVIDSTLTSGYQIKSADINGDSLPDLIAVSTSLPEIYWYENPTWKKQILDAGTQANIDLAPHDIDGDQDIDLAIASGFSLGNSISGGYIHWLENIDFGRSWKIHFIDSIPTSHRLRWADLDGDGKDELVNLPIIGKGAKSSDYDTPVQFCYYTIPINPVDDHWKKWIIDSSLHMAHGMQLVQWPESTKWSGLTASFEGVNLFTSNVRSEELIWKKIQLGEGQKGIRPKIGSSEVGLGSLNSGDTPFLATIEPWHGDKVVVYYPRTGEELWQREIIDTTFRDGHALLCADLDQDGYDEIIAGHRGLGYNLYFFRFDLKTQNWNRHDLDRGGMSAAGLCLLDFNADGYLDIAACGSATHNVVLYVNQR